MLNSDLVQWYDRIMVSHLQLWDTLPLSSAHPSSRHPLLDTIHPTQATNPYQSTQDMEACPTPLHLRTNTLQLVSYFIWHLVDFLAENMKFWDEIGAKANSLAFLSSKCNGILGQLKKIYIILIHANFQCLFDWFQTELKQLPSIPV